MDFIEQIVGIERRGNNTLRLNHLNRAISVLDTRSHIDPRRGVYKNRIRCNTTLSK